MAKIIQFQDPELGTLYFEVEETSVLRDGGMKKVGDESSEGKFEEALKKVRGIAGKLIDKVSSLPKSPDEVECKIGIKFNVETGIIIAKSSSEGNLEITLKWKKETKPETPKA